MEHLNETISFSIAKLVTSFDSRIGSIVDSSTGRELNFRMGRILGSLLDSGLDFYEALDVLGRIETKLEPRMETRDISVALVEELEDCNSVWAKEFRVKYNESITLKTEGSDSLPLCMAELRRIATDKLEILGYRWTGRRVLDDVASSLLMRCRRLLLAEIPEKLLDQVFEQELVQRLEGRTLYQYRDEMPSLVASASERAETMVEKMWETSDSVNFYESISALCKSLLFYFGVVPPIDTVECFNATVVLLDQARAYDAPLKAALRDFQSSSSEGLERFKLVIPTSKLSEDLIIERTKATLRKLSYWTQQESLYKGAFLRRLKNSQKDVSSFAMFLANFCIFLWPEEWLAASTQHRLRHEVLRNLFRYRSLSIDRITRLLQVHPKHTMRALIHLERDGLVALHRLCDGELAIITAKGEQYCEEDLSLKLRCSLSGL